MLRGTASPLSPLSFLLRYVPTFAILVMFQLAPLIAAALPPRPSIGESMVFQLNGLIVVLVALCTIWGVLELTGIYFRRVAASPPSPALPVGLGALAPVVSAPDGVSSETVAVIAAAVSATIPGPHRIHAIAPLSSESERASEARRTKAGSDPVR